MAVMAEPDVDAAPVIAAEPQRRRVRRKPASASATVETVLDTAIEPNEAEPVTAAVDLDVTPAEAAAEALSEAPPAEMAVEAPPAEPVPAVLAEPVPAPKPEADLSALVANDPAQIAAPPEKPKRGWWRR
ncbi:MAG: hypothetical protein DCE92_13110 [Alphaproteobacteria bacterium]|nr:MAG: hypothetical protein DCE92_13110 [Alphaproteobacteria bacterium]